jgi:hypothetical protein
MNVLALLLEHASTATRLHYPGHILEVDHLAVRSVLDEAASLGAAD